MKQWHHIAFKDFDVVPNIYVVLPKFCVVQWMKQWQVVVQQVSRYIDSIGKLFNIN